MLRRRLRFLGLLCVAVYAFLNLVVVPIPILTHLWRGKAPPLGDCLTFCVNSLEFLTFGGLTVLLWWGRPLSLRGLRAVEMVTFGMLSFDLLTNHCIVYWLHTALPHTLDLYRDEQDHLASQLMRCLTSDVVCPWIIVIVFYGILIPNTTRRCALVVGTMASIPILVTLVAGLAGALPLELSCYSLVWIVLSVGQAAAIAIYGSHRIEVLRRQAADARRLGQYQLQRLLGSGGMGEVYLAEHVLLKRPCAVKLIRPERAGDARNLLRFEREVKTTATLTHPNTVQIFDYGHTPEGTFYYVMEYLPGLTLEQLVGRCGPLPPARAVHFLRQLCGALREAHAADLVHRDLKPSNVMVCERGGLRDVAKLLDFGLVLPMGEGIGSDKLTQVGALVGTPAYVSPEQAAGQEALDARSDVYSLGALVYFLLTGRSPFAGRSPVQTLAAHLYEDPPPMANLRPEVPPDLEAVVRRCLAKDPAGRFPDAASLEVALTQCRVGGEWTQQQAASWWDANPDGKVPVLEGSAGAANCT